MFAAWTNAFATALRLDCVRELTRLLRLLQRMNQVDRRPHSHLRYGDALRLPTCFILYAANSPRKLGSFGSTYYSARGAMLTFHSFVFWQLWTVSSIFLLVWHASCASLDGTIGGTPSEPVQVTGRRLKDSPATGLAVYSNKCLNCSVHSAVPVAALF